MPTTDREKKDEGVFEEDHDGEIKVKGDRSRKHRRNNEDDETSDRATKKRRKRKDGLNKKRSRRKRDYSSSSSNGSESDYDSLSPSSSDDDSSSSSDDESSHDRRKRRRDRHMKKKERKRRSSKHRKKKDKSNKKKKKKKSSKDERRENSDNDDSIPRFGKYGVIKTVDFNRMQRSFQMWMEEVKKISLFSGQMPKREQMEYFAEFCEDYNTATMPHKKFYNYEAYEMEEYQKQQQKQQQQQQQIGDGTAAFGRQDELRHQQEQRLKAAEKAKKEREALLSTMSSEKIAEMKQQAALKSQLQVAFQTGDTKMVQRLKERLGPDE